MKEPCIGGRTGVDSAWPFLANSGADVTRWGNGNGGFCSRIEGWWSRSSRSADDCLRTVGLLLVLLSLVACFRIVVLLLLDAASQSLLAEPRLYPSVVVLFSFEAHDRKSVEDLRSGKSCCALFGESPLDMAGGCGFTNFTLS